jgi:hypothetical protein
MLCVKNVKISHLLKCLICPVYRCACLLPKSSSHFGCQVFIHVFELSQVKTFFCFLSFILLMLNVS